MDQLDAMRVFVAVAEAGGFAAASRRLRLSSAATSRAVAQLEDRLGLMLLARTTRSVRLTERGAVYLETCRRVLADLDDGERLTRGEDADPRGVLTVSAPVLFGRLHVLPVVEAMMRRHPRLDVRLMLSDRQVSLVEEGVDVALRIGELADSALVARRVSAVQRVLVASPDYLAARGAPATPADLEGHDIVAFEGVDATLDWRFGGEGRQSVRPRPRLSVNSADAAVAAVERGLGITRALSYQVLDGLAAGRLALVLQAFAPAPIPVSLVHPPTRLASPNVGAFMTAASQAIARLPLLPN
ncbi:LysR family transcriptional regulator [Caulobacter sp. KR2-114]|uniref:LysR family transcriptional regulator n=1 Tax=Caulobacter sp. KR2-114 TaxID=3400912 RepID=UPI003C0F4DA1